MDNTKPTDQGAATPLTPEETLAWLQATNAVEQLGRKLRKLIGHRPSKHMKNGVRSTKKYADGRQKKSKRRKK
jgi:hypothetical protein